MDGEGDTSYNLDSTTYGEQNNQDYFGSPGALTENPSYSDDYNKQEYCLDNNVGRNTYEETNVDEIVPYEDTPDSAVPKLFVNILGSPDKPAENGEIPMLFNKENEVEVRNYEQSPESGCGVDCMYYTLLCCECSIL